ncbi:acyl-CoA thioesterase [Rubripirellula amarantea]|nr:acyl-CoA thioesterase [Rubripirellula amarantea]
MSQVYITQRMVEFADTDMAGIMHFASFFHYMESVEHEFIRSLGLSVYTQIEGMSISFPRVAAKCDFKSPAKCEDVLDAALILTKIGRSSISYQIDFSRTGTPVATGEVTCVCCHIFHDRPPESTPLPDEFKTLLLPYLAQ